MDKKRLHILAVMFFILIPIFLFWKIIISNIILYSGDGAGYLSGKEFLRTSLLNGSLPLWNNFNAAGVPFAADIQNAIFYPFNLLILIFPVNIGFKLYFIMHLSLAAIGMYFLVNKITKNISLAFISGIVLMFSNILIIRFNHINILASIAWVPFILLATDILIEKIHIKYAMILGALLALQFLAGFPQISIYTDIFIFAYYIAYCIHNKSNLKSVIKRIVVFISCYIGLIAVQLLPLAQLIMYSNRGNVEYNTFISYSQSWKMLIQMIFPSFWGTLSSNLNIAVEFPSDIYIGIIPLILCIYGVCFHFSDFRVRILFISIIVIYLYASCGEIDILGKVLYHIPILNSFRVPCRIISLAVIVLYILAFYSFHLLIEKAEFKKYMKVSYVLFILAILFVLLINFFTSPIFTIINEQYRNYYTNSNLYLPAILLLIINILFFQLYFRLSKLKLNKQLLNAYLIFIGIFIVFDVYHLNRDTWADSYRIFKLNRNPNQDIFKSDVGVFLGKQKDKDKYRVIVDYDNMEEYYSLSPDITGNNNIIHQYMTLHSYISFQNPNFNNLFKSEDSQFLTSNNLLTKINPSLISFFSAKYIVKRESDATLSYQNIIGKNIIHAEPQQFEMDCDINSLMTHVIPIKVENNKIYMVTMEMSMDKIPNLFSVDLYGGSGSYDYREQEVSLLPYLNGKDNKISFLINSGNYEIPDDTNMRIILNGDSKLIINKFEVSEVRTKNEKPYIPIYNDNEYIVYENPFAKPLLYVPQKIIGVKNAIKSVNENILSTDLANNVFVEDSKNYDFSNIKASISNINVKNNNVSANISSDTNTFVIMTQTWYPGWKAYVDNNSVPIKLVNGVVPGIDIPKGDHVIKFIFTSPIINIGFLISAFTLILMFFYLYKIYSTNCKISKSTN